VPSCLARHLAVHRRFYRASTNDEEGGADDMSLTWWFFIGVLVVLVALACWNVYESRRPKRGPIRTSRPAKTRINFPPDVPPGGM
jgi:hypothetical protein